MSIQPCNHERHPRALDPESWANPSFEEMVISAARKKQWVFEIRGMEDHAKALSILRKQYRFPDILGLVGPPDLRHHDKDGTLTIGRVAELLLLGVYSWQGFCIARHPLVFGIPAFSWGRRYYLPMRAKWKPSDRGWFEIVDKKFDWEDYCRVSAYRGSLAGMEVRKLSRTFVELRGENPAGMSIVHRDGNVYNCAPENLSVQSLRGRPQRCTRCGKEVGDEPSYVFRVDGSRRRFCIPCLKQMEGVVGFRRIDR